jgi:hypothetical protein
MLHRNNRSTLLLFFIGTAGILFLVSLYHRWIYLDDAWFGEHAFQLIKTGRIRSEILQGFFRYEEKVLTTHKFCVLNGAILIKMFGYSPYVLKAVPIPYLLGLLFIFYRYSTDFKIFNDASNLLLLILLFISYSFVFEFSYNLRPEIMMAAMGFTSFYCLQKFLSVEKVIYIILAGILAGLCVFSHLNGVIFISAGGIVLLINRKLLAGIGFGIVAVLTSLLYFFDIRGLQDWELALYQFRNDAALSDQNFTPSYYIFKVLNEHTRFFHDWREVSLSIVLILVLLLCWKYLKQKAPYLLQYTLSLVLSLALVSRGSSSLYYILYIPFFMVIITIGIDHIFWQGERKWKYVVVIALAIYMIINTVLNIRLISRREDLVAVNHAIAHWIPKQARITTTNYFVFNEIDNFDVQSHEVFYYLRKKNKLGPNADFLDFCKANNRQYIILDEPNLGKLAIDVNKFKAGNRHYKYLTTVYDKYIILGPR